MLWKGAAILRECRATVFGSSKRRYAKDFSQTEGLCNRSRATERGGEEAVGAMPVRPKAQPLARVEGDALRRQQLGAGQRRELGMLRAERIDHGLVLLSQDAARRVDQAPARPDELRGGLEDAPLLLRELGDGLRPVAPLQVGI